MKKVQLATKRKNSFKHRPVERRGDFCYNDGSMTVHWHTFLRAKQKQLLKWWKMHGTRKNIVVASVTLCGALIVLVASIAYRNPKEPTDIVVPTTIDAVSRHSLTGEVVPEEFSQLPQVFGVMIENAADAWPLSGVDEAFLVFEAPVEGNIPRFLAFFSEEQDVEKIGPVRSARDYFLDWNAELDGIYAHVGGSPQALERIREGGVMDLDQFFQSEYFYRNELTRYAPHNVYTTTEDLRRAMSEMRERYAHDVPEYDVWQFVDGTSASAAASVIHLDWSNSSGYNVDWVYDPAGNLYIRKQGGNVYGADNVVVVETSVDVIAGDDKGRKELVTIGTGEMHLFHNGIEIVGTWEKLSAKERLRFFDDAGNEIVMNAGTTWIEIIDTLERLSVSEQKTGPTR